MSGARQEVEIVKLRYVGNVPFFSALSEEEQECISQRMHLERRSSGETLFRKGDLCTALYLIKAGWVRLTVNGGAAIASQGPGSLVGETDLFLDQPHTIGATLSTDAELWVLSRQDLIDLIAANPSIGLKLSLAFGARLALFDQYLIERRLKPLAFLAGLKDEALAAIARRLVPLEKKQGEMIVESGQPPEALFIIESGQVHLHGSEEGGDFAELSEGETFGEMALLTGKPHVRSAQAATDVVLWALPAAEFGPLTGEYPEVRLALSKSIHGPLLSQDMSRAVERLVTMPLFAGLSEEVLWAVAQRLLLRHVPAGEQIFAEGSPGDALFLIDSGQVELVSGAGRAVLARPGADEFFGEMALLTGKPRSTAARAAVHTNLWVLYRSDFEDLVNRYPSLSLALSRVLSQRLAELDRRFTEGHLRGLRLLAGLSPGQLEEISRRLQPVRFRQGEAIIREGEPGEEMFFIESGRVQVIRGQGPRTLLLAELEAGDLFGEMALLTGAPRSATVMALSDVDLWVMSRSDFDEVVTAYPNLALALSRLLSERLRNTDVRLLKQPAATAAAPARPAPRAVPAEKPRPAPRARPARQKARRNLARDLSGAFEDLAVWFGGLSGWAKARLVLVVLLLAYVLGVAAPWLVIRTLAADDVTNLEGAIAFVQVVPPTVAALSPAAGMAPSARALALGGEGQPAPVQAPAPPEATPVAQPPAGAPSPETPANDPGDPVQVSPEPNQEPPTATPWVIVVTNTPPPPTDTPPPPTDTPVPTPTPAAPKPAAKPLAPTATPVPVERPQPPRNLDPRLASLRVEIVPAGVRPGQFYWRLIEARWENEAEAGGDHTIYIQVLDENGGRLVGQPVEIRWPGGSLNVFTEDKPPPEYGANFPMYNTLGSYSVSVPGLPSDTIVGLGMGTAEQPAFTVHTNFFLTFQRVKR